MVQAVGRAWTGLPGYVLDPDGPGTRCRSAAPIIATAPACGRITWRALFQTSVRYYGNNTQCFVALVAAASYASDRPSKGRLLLARGNATKFISRPLWS